MTLTVSERRRLAKFNAETWTRAIHVGESGPALQPLIDDGLLEKKRERAPLSRNVPVTSYRLTLAGRTALL